MQVTIVGQGYVGLPVSMAISACGHKVVGIDSNPFVVTNLNQGISHIEDVKNIQLRQAIMQKSYFASSDLSYVEQSDVIVVCLPTPLLENKLPNLEILETAVAAIAKKIKPGIMIIIESTIQPGTTRNSLLPIIIRNSGLKIGDFDLAFSPERIDPGNSTWNLSNTPKLVAGVTDRAGRRAMDFYSSFVNNIHYCDSVEIAETAKLLENTFRLINISFINELSMFCDEIKIDIASVIQAASTKPYGFMAFYPSIGAGGHCIPVDPIYLSERAKAVNVSSRLIDTAIEINNEMPSYFLSKAEKKIGSMKDKKILVIGIAYKANVSDIRESPVISLINLLREKGAKVLWHDDLVAKWNGESSVEIRVGYDLAILAAHHDYIDLSGLGSTPILYTKNSL